MESDKDFSGQPAIAATVFGLVLPITAVAARLVISKIYRGNKTLLLEDYFLVLALAFKIAMDVAGIILLENGLGRHMNTLPANKLVSFAKTQYTGSLLYPGCITLVKMSVLFQYRRMFVDRFRFRIYALMAVVLLWCVAVWLVAAVLCIPIQKLWTPSISGSCVDLTSFYYGMQIPNIVTDTLLIVCPVHMTMSLDITWKRRFAAAAMFCLGLLTLAFSIIRLQALLELNANGMADPTYNEVYPAVWTTLEPSIAIVASCLPSIRFLGRKISARHSVYLTDTDAESCRDITTCSEARTSLQPQSDTLSQYPVRIDSRDQEKISQETQPYKTSQDVDAVKLAEEPVWFAT